MTKFQCPKCGSNEFVTKPNKYECLRFIKNDFHIDRSEIVNEEYRIYCRECGAEIDEEKSLEKRKIIVKVRN